MVKAGIALDKANKVAIMIHGRGATAESIMSLKNHLNLDDFALIAPQASGNTWYPYSFMAPDATNEPAFSKAFKTIDEIVNDLKSKGFTTDQIFLIGFSQGACLSLEYATQNAQKYGGVVAFTGGLIGENINPDKYKGDFNGTKVFIGSSQRDMHVPLFRIEDSAELIKERGGNIKTLIFKDSEHTIRKEEVDWVNENILK